MLLWAHQQKYLIFFSWKSSSPTQLESFITIMLAYGSYKALFPHPKYSASTSQTMSRRTKTLKPQTSSSTPTSPTSPLTEETAHSVFWSSLLAPLSTKQWATAESLLSSRLYPPSTPCMHQAPPGQPSPKRTVVTRKPYAYYGSTKTSNPP